MTVRNANVLIVHSLGCSNKRGVAKRGVAKTFRRGGEKSLSLSNKRGW